MLPYYINHYDFTIYHFRIEWSVFVYLYGVNDHCLRIDVSQNDINRRRILNQTQNDCNVKVEIIGNSIPDWIIRPLKYYNPWVRMRHSPIQVALHRWHAIQSVQVSPRRRSCSLCSNARPIIEKRSGNT